MQGLRLITKLSTKYLSYIYKSEGKERRSAQEQILQSDHNAWVLDCGCREGDTTVKVLKKINTKNVIGLDYNYKVLKMAYGQGIKATQSDLNISIPLESNSIDVVFASDVLEHLVNTRTFISEIYRVLKAGGYAVIDTPNLASWHNVFALIIGLQPFSGPNISNMEDAELGIVRRLHRLDHGLEEEGETPTHYEERELTRHIVVVTYRSLLRLVINMGFIVELKRCYGYYPFPPAIAKVMQRLDPYHAHHILIKISKPL